MIEINLMGPSTSSRRSYRRWSPRARAATWSTFPRPRGWSPCPGTPPTARASTGFAGLSEVLRFDLARHRIGVSVVVPGAVKTRRCSPCRSPAWTARSECQEVDRPIRRPRRLTRTRRGPHLARCAPKPVPHLHVARHPRAVPVQADRMVALQRGDAPGERVVHPCAAPANLADAYRVMPSASVIVKNRSV